MTNWNKFFGVALILGTLVLYAGVEFKEGKSNPNDIQVVPVDPSREANDISLRLQYPASDAIETEEPITAQMRLDWFPLGVDSESKRKNQVYSDGEGQSIHVFIDEQPYFEVTEALSDALDDHDTFFNQSAEFEIPFALSPGAHIIRAFPCRSYGESIKGSKSFIASMFYYQKKEESKIDLSEPFLTYNTPQGRYESDDRPILLDFYINNCTLSKDGYKVKITINNANQRFLYSWTPYYIYGLKSGQHTIRLELLSPQNTIVPGVFNAVERTFFID